MVRGCLLRSRKGMVFNIMVVIFTIVVLSYAYVQLSNKLDVDHELGEMQFDAVIKMQEGEKALIFLDFASRMALYQSVFDLQSQGGISEAGACGTYYGFNRWNAESGETCFVDADTAKDALRDLFVSNLVARVAAYPSADFVGNVPGAAASRGSALAATDVMGVAAATGEAVSSCGEGDDLMEDFTFSSGSGFFPDDGGRVWVPSEANCPGSYPLIVFLHGCMRESHATKHRNFGDGLEYDIIPLTKRFIQAGTVRPLILAAPSQTRGLANFRGSPDSPCGPSLWGSEFDAAAFVDQVREELPDGVILSSVSFVTHDGAACSIMSGLHSAAMRFSTAYAVGQFDSCASSELGGSLAGKLGQDVRFMAVYASQASPDQRSAHNSALGIAEDRQCPSSEIPGGGLAGCLSNNDAKRFAFTMSDISSGAHGRSLHVGMEHFLKAFFPVAGQGSGQDGGEGGDEDSREADGEADGDVDAGSGGQG